MDEKKSKLECLARWMLDHWGTMGDRQASFNRIKHNHGKTFTKEPRQKMIKEKNHAAY